MSRVAWGDTFPNVFVNCSWASNKPGVNCLVKHPLYQAAKGERDVGAALDILDDLASERTILSLREVANAHGVKPKIIAPSAQPGDSNNALAIGYAQWLGHELDWPVEIEVFQIKAFSRDRLGQWVRIAHNCAFRGEIDKETPYVIVDDVMTLGGTLADLRSFILHKGGSVIAMSAIASKDGDDRPIHLGDEMKGSLERYYGPRIAEFCTELLGYSHLCLTREEGDRLLGCSGYVAFREKILRARNQTNAPRSKNYARR